MFYEALKILDGILVPLVDEKSRYPIQNFRQDIVLRTRPRSLAHVLRKPFKIPYGILVPLVDEKSRYPFQNFRQDIVLRTRPGGLAHSSSQGAEERLYFVNRSLADLQTAH